MFPFLLLKVIQCNTMIAWKTVRPQVFPLLLFCQMVYTNRSHWTLTCNVNDSPPAHRPVYTRSLWPTRQAIGWPSRDLGLWTNQRRARPGLAFSSMFGWNLEVDFDPAIGIFRETDIYIILKKNETKKAVIAQKSWLDTFLSEKSITYNSLLDIYVLVWR